MYNPTQRLMRSRTEKVIAGVAGGIATYLSIDPVLVRLALVALLFTGVGVLLYPILWLIMPLEGGSGPAPEQAIDEMRAQFERAGDQMRDAFASEPPRRPRYDSMTGQPIAEETEIPINNMHGGDTARPAAANRNRQIGVLLLGIGALALASMLLGPAFGKLLIPMLLIGAGLLVLRRG
jgi:phage shock protein C